MPSEAINADMGGSRPTRKFQKLKIIRRHRDVTESPSHGVTAPSPPLVLSQFLSIDPVPAQFSTWRLPSGPCREITTAHNKRRAYGTQHPGVTIPLWVRRLYVGFSVR